MKLKNEKEALQKFCSDDDFRVKLKYPFINEKDNGRLTATDAHIMLMVDTSLLRCKYKSQEVTVPNVESENCNRIVRFADIDAAYNRFKLVPEMVAKDGGTDECPECDGTGTVEYEYTDNEGNTHYHEEDCPICEGDGKRDVEMVPTGRMLLPEKSLFRIDGVTFEARELWKAVEGLRLMGFEQMTWQTAKENRANRFDVCEGVTFLIMPFHYCEDEKGVVTEEIKHS